MILKELCAWFSYVQLHGNCGKRMWYSELAAKSSPMIELASVYNYIEISPYNPK